MIVAKIGGVSGQLARLLFNAFPDDISCRSFFCSDSTVQTLSDMHATTSVVHQRGFQKQISDISVVCGLFGEDACRAVRPNSKGDMVGQTVYRLTRPKEDVFCVLNFLRIHILLSSNSKLTLPAIVLLFLLKMCS